MYKVLLYVTLSIQTWGVMCCGAWAKGEKQMATLIKSERFEGRNSAEVGASMRAGGWVGGTGLFGTAYHLEVDSALGNTFYTLWNGSVGASGDRACPNGGCQNMQYPLSAAQFNQGVTTHFYVKLVGIISGPMPSVGHWHMGPRGLPNAGSSNSPGQFLLEASGQHGYRSLPGSFHTISDGANGWFYGRDNSAGSYLVDNVWFEVAWYWNAGSGGNDGRTAVWYRRQGTTTWNRAFDTTGPIGRRGTGTPWMGFGAYIHGYNPSAHGEKRVYIGQWDLYSGNAFEDGTIGNGGGTEPVEPLTVSNHKASATDTTAALTWSTNKPSNSVVDYGDTEARGTVVRDDNVVTEHTINLSGLTANTTYYYRFSSRTDDGETVMDQANSTFMTKTTDNGGGTEPEPEPIEGSLDDLTDVALNNPVEGQVLMYRDGKWVNVDARPLVAQLVEEILGETSLVVNKSSS